MRRMDKKNVVDYTKASYKAFYNKLSEFGQIKFFSDINEKAIRDFDEWLHAYKWQEKDKRVSVIHKRNGGLSDARNVGLKKATGEYLTFVDSDDYLEPGTYSQVLPLMDNCDIVEFPVEKSVNGEKIDSLDLQERTYDNMKDYWINEEVYDHCYAWNKIYRRELFDGIKFPVGRVFEDIHTLRRLLLNAKCVKTTTKGKYHYCMNEKGITATAKGSELEMLLDAHLAALKHWYTPAYYMRILNTQMDVYELTGKAPMLRFRYISPLASGRARSRNTQCSTKPGNGQPTGW